MPWDLQTIHKVDDVEVMSHQKCVEQDSRNVLSHDVITSEMMKTGGKLKQNVTLFNTTGIILY